LEKHEIAIIQTVIQVILTVVIGFIFARKMEKVKTDLTKKFWVKQQVWDTRKKAYDDLIESFYETKEYLNFLIEHISEYLDAFERVGVNSEGDEEYHNSYVKYVEEEQLKFKNKYGSTDAIAERKRVETDTKNKLSQLKKSLETKYIYLHSDITEIQFGLENIITKLFGDRRGRDQVNGESLDDYLDSIIGSYMTLLRELTSLITRTQDIARCHLELKS